MKKILLLGDEGVGKSTFIKEIAELCEDGVFRLSFQSPSTANVIELEMIEAASVK